MNHNGPPPAYSEQPRQGFIPANYYNPGPPPVISQPSYQNYYPPPAPPPPPPPAAASIIIQTSPSAVPIVSAVGDGPRRIICPHCRVHVLTNVTVRPSMGAHLLAACLCVFGCWPCVCLPYCMDSCQNANHYCPNCNAYIGTYQS